MLAKQLSSHDSTGAGGVDIGGVEEIYAALKCGVDQFAAGAFIGDVAKGQPASQADFRELDT